MKKFHDALKTIYGPKSSGATTLLSADGNTLRNYSTIVWLSLPALKGLLIRGSLPEIAQYSPYYLPLNVLTASRGSNPYILFAITAAGVVPCGGPKKSPRTSSIVQIIFLFRSFEISKGIQSVQNTHV